MMQNSKLNLHLDQLTTLRAFAAFFVVVSHCIRATETSLNEIDAAADVFILRLFDLGTFGVYIFFALSGCTLYLSNCHKVFDLNGYKNFVIKRWFRIWPAFFFSVILYVGLIWGLQGNLNLPEDNWIMKIFTPYSLSDVFVYLSLTHNVFGPNGLIVTPYWSLPVEFQYYLILPLCLFFMGKSRFPILVPFLIGCLLYSNYMFDWIKFDRSEFFKMGYSFFGGVMISYVYVNTKIRLPSFTYPIAFCGAILTFCLLREDYLSLPVNVPFVADIWNVSGVFAVVCVACSMLSKHEPPYFKYIHRFLMKYGEVSYSVYLFHMFFLALAMLIVSHFGIYGQILKLSFVFTFTFVFTFLFSLLTYSYVEKPLINAGRKLSS